MLGIHSLGAGRPVVLVHGFTQSSASWGPVSESLAGQWRVVCLDAPGHGGSSDVEADLPGGAALLVEAAAAAGAGRAAWVGYSMGGRFAMHVALLPHAGVDKLVLVSATAGLEDPAEREERRRSDAVLAARVVDEGLEPFVRWWLSQPMFASLPADAAAIESRLSGTAAGLASSLRLAGTGSQEPLWDRLASLSMPVLVVAGERDVKYARLGARIAWSIGANATLAIIRGAGHACHLERPEEFVRLVSGFLAGR